MNKLLLNIAVCLTLSASYAQASVEPLGVASIEKNMLEQIQLGEALFRDDIVNDALARLYRIAPQHPQGLLAELRLAVRLDQLDRANELLAQLQQVAPKSDTLIQAELLVKLTQADARAQLAQARLYAAAGRFSEAQQMYDGLLQGNYPDADLAVEYWQVRTQQVRQRPLAIAALTASLQAFPKHPSVLRALANYHFQENQPKPALEYLHRLAEQKSQRDFAANREYDYLITLPVSNQTHSLWADFLQRYAELDVATRAQSESNRQGALLGDRAWQAGQAGLRAVEQGRNSQSIAQLKQGIAAYPDDAELYGALGLAYLRTDDRTRALQYFRLAQAKEQRDDQTSKWISLIASTEYWLLLGRADQALAQSDWSQAQQLYQQAHQRDARNIFALVGLADTALATLQPDVAFTYFKRALTLAPADESAQAGILRYIATLPVEQGLNVLTTLEPRNAPMFVQAKVNLNIALLEQRAELAQQEGRVEDQLDALKKIQQLSLANPWASYRLAVVLREQGQEAAALEAYQQHLSISPQMPTSRYAHALLLTAIDRWDAALTTLNAIPAEAWTPEMHDVAQRVRNAQLIEQAQQLYERGKTKQAFALLESSPKSQATRLQLAQWFYELADYAQSLTYYTQVLQVEPDNLDARLGRLENWAAQGKVEQVRTALDHVELSADSQSANVYRRLANLWLLVGKKARAKIILQQQVALLTEPNALLYRDLARLTVEQDAQQALDLYAVSMRDAQLLPVTAVRVTPVTAVTPVKPTPVTQVFKVVKPDPVVTVVRNDEAFTQAMRVNAEDDWLARGLRAEAEELYLREMPTFTLHNDHAWRNDGTSGLSKLNANTTMAHFEFPLSDGRAFLRADHVRMDAGSLKTSADGRYDGRFGSCDFAGTDSQGNRQSLAGCVHGLTQKAEGTSFSAGWSDQQLSFDLGSTPYGFTVQNWVGGISYSDKIGVTGWNLTASRRPLSNSLLSFAGAKDPRTGIEWGGVMANGAALGLSWDQGNADGVWADISYHQLKGKNVADNTRSRLMAGYYHRLINTPHELLTVGVNTMLWRYEKDLSEYTLGHGGYYSPQRYASLSLPVSYAKRTVDWSYVLEGSVSVSDSKSRGMDYYPQQGLIADPWRDLASQNVSYENFIADNRFKGGSSHGVVGYSIRGLVERRLSSYWVLGTGLDWRYSEDYSPSRAMLYLRYSFVPWQGDLRLPIEPITPYADFK